MLVGLAVVDPNHPCGMAMPITWSFRECAIRQISIGCCIHKCEFVARASILLLLALRTNGVSSYSNIFFDQMTLSLEEIGRLLQISRQIDRPCSRMVSAHTKPAVFFFLSRMLIYLS